MAQISEVSTQVEKLGKEISAAKQNVASLEGQEKLLMGQMKDLHGVKTLAEAEKLLDKMSTEITTLETAIVTDFDNLKQDYEW